MHEQTSDPNEPDYVTIRFQLFKTNNERLWTAAAAEGDSFTETLNRAVALYEFLGRTEPGHIVSWQRRDGTTHRVLVLAAGPGTSARILQRSLWYDLLFLISVALCCLSLFNLRGNLYWLIPFVVGLLGLGVWAWRKL